ncbi:hypothetical protein ROBYS_37630 [Roseobacter sp. OBYS 0001]|nr:hypothetical protein ROBYS_37630 [Roseobacter sp. OBYS 0001]
MRKGQKAHDAIAGTAIDAELGRRPVWVNMGNVKAAMQNANGSHPDTSAVASGRFIRGNQVSPPSFSGVSGGGYMRASREYLRVTHNESEEYELY